MFAILAVGFLARGLAVVETCEELMFASNMAASDLTPPGFLLSTIILPRCNYYLLLNGDISNPE